MPPKPNNQTNPAHAFYKTVMATPGSNRGESMEGGYEVCFRNPHRWVEVEKLTADPRVHENGRPAEVKIVVLDQDRATFRVPTTRDVSRIFNLLFDYRTSAFA